MTDGQGKTCMTAATERIGVCSWSLQPKDPAELAGRLRGLAIHRVQLAMSPMVQDPGVWGGAIDELRAAGTQVISGMFAPIGEDYSTLGTIRLTGGVVPDEHWDRNLALATGIARIVGRYGIGKLMFHAGFVPHDRTDPGYEKLRGRLTVLADLFADAGCKLLLETGQETADELLAFLDSVDHPNLGVNFDPANMILYGKGDPIDAVGKLVSRVGSIHIKDAIAAETPGQWGAEVPAGRGQVDWRRFFDVLTGAGYAGDLVIEREAGEDRQGDIVLARDLVVRHLMGSDTPASDP
jgi:L-ribulose-5-phosphate 3-epimerase